MFGIRAGRFPCGRMESSWQREFLPLWFARLLAQAYRARNVASLTASWSLLAQKKSCH